jgi:membrane protease YdiL (CAAX protease family)
MSAHPQQPTQATASAPSTSHSALKHWITRHPVLAYLILAYAVCWTIFVPLVLSNQGLGVLHFDGPPFQLYILAVSMLGLTGSAFTVTAIVDGRPGVRALASRYIRWRVGIQWYLLAFFGLPVLALFAVTIVFGFGPLGALPHQVPGLLNYLFQVVLVAALVNVWEETGWTGFMFTRLQPRFGALVASLLIAPCFGGIHLPLLVVQGAVTTSHLTPALYLIAILELLVLFSIPVRVLAAWVYNNTKGSLLIVGLLHSSWDAVTGATFLSLLLPKGTDAGLVAWGSIIVVALVLILLTRGRLAYKPIAELQPVPSA